MTTRIYRRRVTHIDEHGRPFPPEDAGEIDTLNGFLDYQRATFEWKCRGLDAEGLNKTLGPSSMTLGGLMKHLALVEEHWFSNRLWDREQWPPWSDVDWEADRDWEWHSAAKDSPEELLALWKRYVDQSRSNVAEALAAGTLDQQTRNVRPNDAPNLRWILVHMIEEYARHNGHADLLREAVDGSTGE
jgi:uncharacterized damage-inducible protein DinB